MAAIIKIKRGTLTANPQSTLADGEIGYATNSDASFGKRLYIGTAGTTDDAIVIGGEYFTDIIDAKTSSNTASTLVERDSSGNFSAGTITADLTGDVTGDLTGNADTATQWATARDLSLTGDATATLSGVDGTANVSAAVTLANSGVSAGSYGSSSAIPVITVDAKGRLTAASTASISTSLTVAADTGTGDDVDLANDTFTIAGGEGIDTSISGDTVTISAEDASDSNKGVASFSSTNFTVSSGAVSIANGGVDTAQLAADAVDGTKIADDSIDSEHIVDGSIDSAHLAADVVDGTKIADDAIDSEHITDGSVDNVHLANSAITIGSDSVSLGGTQTDLNGITSLDVDNVTIDGNTISTTNSNGDLTLSPNGSGVVSVSGGLTISGDLTVAGTTTTVESTTVTIDDPILSLADNNTSSDAVDIGFYGTYSSDSGSTQEYTGFFRDATDKEYYLVTGLSGAPGTTFTYTESTDLAALNAIIDGGTF